jgi:digeranylgeranylglycerophospholipid reductase
MTLSIPCDILVVGGGPAGSRAATVSARSGARTVLIDAKVRIGEQPHCGEFVPSQLFVECGIEPCCIVQAVDEMETRVFGSEPEAPWEALRPPVRACSRGFIIDRIRFDRTLAREAAAAGATVLSGTRLSTREGDAWLARMGSQSVLFRPRFVVAADGAVSTVARVVGLPPTRVLRGVQMEVPLRKPSSATVVFLHPSLVGGYAWLFPKGTVANLGLGVAADDAVHPRELLEVMAARLRHQDIIGPGRLAISGGLIPISGLRERLVRDSVVFCGDAAGLTHPITGAGIPQAVISGDLAGAAVSAALRSGDGTHLERYEREVISRFRGVLGHALSKRAFMETCWGDGDFDRLCESTWIAFRGYRKRMR